MKNQLHFRSILFATVLILFGAVIEDAAAQTCPILPSPVIPSQRSSMRSSSKVKGAEPQSLQLYNSGDPSVDEQYYLELLNAARINPPAAGVGISNTTDPNVTFEFTYWAGQDANEPTRASIKSDFANYQPKQPLAMNASLLTAARVHSQDMLTNNYQGHQGTDGSWPWDRAQKAGYPTLGGGGGSPYVGENAAAYAIDVYDAYAGWLIDFGVPNDTQWGHRNNCLEFRGGSDTINPGYTECGPGMIPDPGEGYPTHTGPLVSTLDLGDAGKNFILGVVYIDQNNNGLYDPGEGDSGVTITLSSGSYYAVSSGAGGYAIPFSGTGSVTVTAQGGQYFPTPVSKTVDFEGQNIKVDFSPNLSGYPTQVSLVSPIGNIAVASDTVDFIWDTMAVAASYHIQVATDSLFKKIFKNDSGIKPASIVFSGLKDTTIYFWRVQAKNAKGVGGWSSVASFFIQLPQPSLVPVAPPNAADVGDSIIEFIWHSPGYMVLQYNLIVCSDNAMMDTVFTDMPTDTTDVIFDPSVFNINAGQTYYWEVLAQSATGWNHPSAIRSFVTATASVNPSITSGSTPVTISPNPSSGSAEIQFTLATSEDVSLRVFNSLGQQVQLLHLGRFSAGTNNCAWDCSALLAGSYTCQLRMGDQIENARVVILK